MDEQLQKSLISLIDETLQDIEDLKKSRFAASEIKIEGAGENALAGKPVNGSMEKEEDDKDEDDDKEDKAEKADDMDKKEDKEDDKDDSDDSDDDMDKAEDKEDKDEDKKEDKEDMKEKMKEMKKSFDDSEALMKSYIDSRIQPLETKLSSILEAVTKLADQPASSKGFTAKFVPLQKSADGSEQGEPMSKSDIATKLFDLKKSGTPVDSMDITRVELGQDLNNITKKYNLK